MADHRKTLTGRAAKYNIYLPVPNAGPSPDLRPGQPDDRLWEHDAAWKVVYMYSTVDGVNFDCSGDIKTGLLKPQSKAARASKQIDSDWSWHRNHLPSFISLPASGRLVDRNFTCGVQKGNQSSFQSIGKPCLALPNIQHSPPHFPQGPHVSCVLKTIPS
jgi:hypothetical protein